jgi:hypothetical protein
LEIRYCNPVGESPTCLTFSQQGSSEPAYENMKPGVAREQAASLNPEICIVVVHQDKPYPLVGMGKADAVQRAEGSSQGYVVASIQDTTGVCERGMFSKGLPGNLGEPVVSLLREPGKATGEQEPGADRMSFYLPVSPQGSTN